MLVIGIIFSCTVCSGLDSFADNLKSGAEQLNKDVAIGKSNACIINELITKILEGNKRRINGEKVQSIKSITVHRKSLASFCNCCRNALEALERT